MRDLHNEMLFNAQSKEEFDDLVKLKQEGHLYNYQHIDVEGNQFDVRTIDRKYANNLYNFYRKRYIWLNEDEFNSSPKIKALIQITERVKVWEDDLNEYRQIFNGT